MNNYLIYEWFEKMGHYSVRRRYVELFLHSAPGRLTTGDYHGVYVLVEKIRVDSNRVDIAKLTPSDNLPPAVTGGYIFSRDKISPTDLTFTTTSGEQLIDYRPDASTITPAQYNYLVGYLDTFEAALYGANWRDPVNGYANYIDVDSFVDMHWITEFTKNVDGIALSNYFHKDRNGPVAEGPIWDWDLALGNGNYADCGHTNNWRYQLMDNNSDIWLSKLRTDPDFYQKIIDRWGVVRLDVFNVTNIFARIDQVTNYLWEAKDRDFKRWPRLGTYVWPNCNGAAGGWDIDYVTPRLTTASSRSLSTGSRAAIFGWTNNSCAPPPGHQWRLAVDQRAGGRDLLHLGQFGSSRKRRRFEPLGHALPGPIPLTNNADIFARAFRTNAWSPPAKPSISPPFLPCA